MSKVLFAVLLFAAGLGLGLWLGFDPERRAAVEQNWERATETVSQVQTEVGLDLKEGQPAPEAAAPEQKAAPSGASPLEPLAQLLEDIWNATRQLWFSMLAKLELAP